MRPIGRPELFPDDEGSLYEFLRRTAQEWQFFIYADALGLPEADKLTVAGATLARNYAVDMWNRWMYKQRDREWFLVHQRHTLEEDYRNERRGIFLTAGSSVLVVHRCESALAHVAKRERPILAPDGTPTGWGWEEQVVLHCVFPPPREEELKILPVTVVPTVSVFNH